MALVLLRICRICAERRALPAWCSGDARTFLSGFVRLRRNCAGAVIQRAEILLYTKIRIEAILHRKNEEIYEVIFGLSLCKCSHISSRKPRYLPNSTPLLFEKGCPYSRAYWKKQGASSSPHRQEGYASRCIHGHALQIPWGRHHALNIVR